MIPCGETVTGEKMEMTMETNWRIVTGSLGAVMLLILLLSCLSGCSGGEKQEEEDAVRPVRYIVLQAEGLQKSRTFSGTVVAARKSTLSFKVSGTALNIPVKVGNRVQTGELLAKLDETDLKVEVESAGANLKTALADVQAARTAVNTSRSNYERVEKLYESDNVSLSEFEKALGDFETAKAQLQAAKSQAKTAQSKLEAAENQLAYTVLRAPYDGIINSVDIDENEEVRPGDPVLTLNELGKLEVLVNLSDMYIANIFQGMECLVSFPSFPGLTFSGSVSEIPYATVDSPTYPVKISLNSESEDIRPGMAADIFFTFTKNNAQNDMKNLFLPVGAVGEDAGENFVYVLEQQAEDAYTAQKRVIQLGTLTEKGFLVTKGLSEGEYVATSGLQVLLDGMEVRLMDTSLEEW